MGVPDWVLSTRCVMKTRASAAHSTAPEPLADRSLPVLTTGFLPWAGATRRVLQAFWIVPGNPVPLESLTWVINDDNAMGFFGTPFGNGRNIFFGDNTVLFNVGFIKNTRFGPDGRFNAQLRVTSRNIFNHRNFGVPPTNIDNAATFGVPQANDVEGRFFELGLRFEF